MPSSYAEERRSIPTREPRPEHEGRGLVIFSAVLLLTLGVMQLVEGVTSLTNGYAYVTGSAGELIEVDAVDWGWMHLVLGAVTAPAGLGVLFGQTWARVVGVVVAAFGAILHMMSTAASPVSGMILVALDLLVIYARTVHGGQLRRHGRPTRR